MFWSYLINLTGFCKCNAFYKITYLRMAPSSEKAQEKVKYGTPASSAIKDLDF